MSEEKNSMVSDEYLNAFIDDQLDTEQRSEILEALRQDQTLSQRSCELQKLQDMVQLTYTLSTAETRQTTSSSPQASFLRTAIAACLALVVGLGAGWSGHRYLAQGDSLLQLAQIIHTSPALQNDEEWKVLLHINSYDPYRLNVLLDEAEHLLQASQAASRKLKLEILANSQGLKLFDTNTSDFARRLQALQQRYTHLLLSACNQAISRTKQETGTSIRLLPGVQVVKSATAQVLARQKQGWTYIKI